MQLEVLDHQGNVEKSIEVSEANFDAELNSALVHQVSVACRAASRAGTHAQKNSCLLYTSPSPRDRTRSRMPSSA